MLFLPILAIDAAALALWSRFLKRRDRYAAKKRPLAWFPVFLLGGFASAPFCVPLRGAIDALNAFGSILSGSEDGMGRSLYMVFVVGGSEELAKFLVFWLISKKTKSLREPFDALAQGATVGLGFAIVENFIYGYDYGIAVLLLRSLICVSGHMAYGALAAFAYGATLYWSGLRKDRLWIGLPLAGLAGAAFLHGMHNGLAASSWPLLVLALDSALAFALARALSDSSRLSPYFSYPVSERETALRSLAYGLERDPENWFLLQRQGAYRAAGGDWAGSEASFDLACLHSEGAPQPRAYRALSLIARGEAERGRAELAASWRRMAARDRKALRHDIGILFAKDRDAKSRILGYLS